MLGYRSINHCCSTFWNIGNGIPTFCSSRTRHLSPHTGRAPPGRKIWAGILNSPAHCDSTYTWSIETGARKGQAAMLVNTEGDPVIRLDFSWSGPNTQPVPCVWGAVWSVSRWLFALWCCPSWNKDKVDWFYFYISLTPPHRSKANSQQMLF